MLLKLNFLEGQKRKPFFETTPLRTVYVFANRISFDKADVKGNGNGLLAYAWFVWEIGYSRDGCERSTSTKSSFGATATSRASDTVSSKAKSSRAGKFDVLLVSNDKAHRSAPGGDVERKGNDGKTN